jgi:hypothetical protein
MHEILVIFKKDVRRLWWQIAAMLAMSAITGCLDAGRAAAQPGVVEGLLDILLPLVWACLIAQAIHQEALVGDREFWMTRPYRWLRLLAAKALFAVLFVHVPSFVTDAAILAARGYNPLHALPQLLVKQLVLAGGLTLPAMALAAVVSNLTQFVVGVPVLFATLAAAVALRRVLPMGYAFQHAIGSRLGGAVIAMAAASIVILQYWRRRTKLARVLAISAGVGVGGLILLFFQPITFSMNTAKLPAANIHLTMTLDAPDPRAIHGPTRRVFSEFPITVSGVPENEQAIMSSVTMEIAGANGVRYLHDPPRVDFEVAMMSTANRYSAISVGMRRADYERIKDSKVTISGTAGFVLHKLLPEVRLPVGAAVNVTERMHCSSTYDEGRYDVGYLRVYCDSPYRDGLLFDLPIQEMRRSWLWPGYGAVGTNGSPAPLLAWLSPLERRELSYGVGTPRDRTASEALADTPIVIVPRHFAGYATATFKAVDIDLREYSK